jgi:hypothetical protein
MYFYRIVAVGFPTHHHKLITGGAMRLTMLLLIWVCSSICPAQTDTMFVEMMDGTIRAYQISLIHHISTAGDLTDVHDREIMHKVLTTFMVQQNFPNPFNPSTTIQYSIPTDGVAEVNIYDIQGCLVRSLLKMNQQAGTHSVVWDSHNNAGSIVASGIYFYQVLFDGAAIVKKLVTIK